MLLSQNPNLVREWFDYVDATGELLWKQSPSRNVNVGSVCGCSRGGYKRRYKYITFRGKKYLHHRLVWAWVHGEWPKEVDHIDGDVDNNRITNLRSVNRRVNAKNVAVSSRTKSGVFGVYWNKQKKKWHSVIKVSGRQIHLGFSIDYFEAVCVRKRAELFYNFHPNHGRMPNS